MDMGEDGLELSLELSVGGCYRKRKTEDSNVDNNGRSDFSSEETCYGFVGYKKRGGTRDLGRDDEGFPKRKQARNGGDDEMGIKFLSNGKASVSRLPFSSSRTNADTKEANLVASTATSLQKGGSISIDNGSSSSSLANDSNQVAAAANPDDDLKNLNSSSSFKLQKSSEKCSTSSSITEQSASPSSRKANGMNMKPPKAPPNQRNDDNGGGASAPYMPRVSATGNGPNGKTIRGFLYKYSIEEVSIICVCHGYSFSPASFVEHAGGVDISNPLRHITVVHSSSSSSSLER